MPPSKRQRRDYDAQQGEEVEEETEEGEIVLQEGEEQVWAGFYASIVSGAAAGNSGRAVDLDILAEEADDMLRLYRERLGER